MTTPTRVIKWWVTTDTHFGHDNMVAYCGRPEDFSNRIMNNLCKMVLPGDILIHLGDVCIGNDADWHAKLQDNTPGVRRILVRGNHDKKSNSWYLSHGWDFVCDTFSLNHLGKDIVFSHQPVIICGHDFNIHGHFHNQLNRLRRREWVVPDEEERNHYVLKNLTKNHINISLEETDYKPILLTSKFLESEIA